MMDDKKTGIEHEEILLENIDYKEKDENSHSKVVRNHVLESFITELRHNDSTRFKVILSVCATMAYSMLGWNKGQTGPAFLDILYITGSDLEQGSVFMTSYSGGRAIGSIAGGTVYSKVNRYLLLVVTLLIYSLTRALIPWCAIYELMVAVQSIHGIFAGMLHVVLTSMAASIWGATARGRVFLSLFMASDPLAGLIAPMITSPFLLPRTSGGVRSADRWNTSVTTGTYPTDLIVGNISTANTVSQSNVTDTEMPESRIYIAYTITAALAFLSAIPFIVMYFKSLKQEINGSVNEESHFVGSLPSNMKWLQLGNVGLFSTFYISVYFLFTGYLSAFSVEHLQWTKASGAWLTSEVFLALLIGRLVCAYVSQILKPMKTLTFSTVLHVMGLVGLSVSGFFVVDEGIWIFVFVIGIAWSMMWPSMWSWTNENLISVRGKVTAFIMLMGYVGTLLNPLLFGYMMEEFSLMWFCFLNLAIALIMTMNVFLMIVYTRCLATKSGNDKNKQISN